MEQVRVERLDHLGLIASVMKDLGLIAMIDRRLVPDVQEVITPGEAVAGMILNGLGFANRPLSLTPQFFANKPLDLLFRNGIDAEMFNRFKLGRALDEAYAYGCNLLFEELALAVCTHEGIDLRFNHLDTTSFCLTGEYIPDSDEHAICITHGYSKDHRPDLKQAVLELMVSQDGGVPFVSKSWDGNTADTQIFQERAQALMQTFASSPTPRYLVADSKLYTEDNAATLRKLRFITRIPNTLKLVAQHTLIEHKRYGGKGRPTSTSPIKAIAWQIQARVRPDAAHLAHLKHSKACFVLGSNIAVSQASDTEVIRAYKGQAQAEEGFRFLKDPLFFVSSLFVKKPCRIQGLLMVMTLALLVYAVGQRRLRQQLARQNETVPNQINQPTQRPTLRWIFQLLDGIHRIRVTVQGRVHDFIEGLNDVKLKVLRLFGEGVCRLYQISPG